jgi:hypothetical protein
MSARKPTCGENYKRSSPSKNPKSASRKHQLSTTHSYKPQHWSCTFPSRPCINDPLCAAFRFDDPPIIQRVARRVCVVAAAFPLYPKQTRRTPASCRRATGALGLFIAKNSNAQHAFSAYYGAAALRSS